MRIRESDLLVRLALELDPRSAVKCVDLADTYGMLRDYEMAEMLFDRALSMGPPTAEIFHFKLKSVLLHFGNLDSARQVIRETGDYMDPVAALAMASQSGLAILGFWRFDLLDEDLEDLPDRIGGLFESPRLRGYYASMGQFYESLGQTDLVEVYCGSRCQQWNLRSFPGSY